MKDATMENINNAKPVACDAAPSGTVNSQPAPGTVGLRPFETADQVGEVPHFANGVGRDEAKSKGQFGDGKGHWSKH